MLGKHAQRGTFCVGHQRNCGSGYECSSGHDPSPGPSIPPVRISPSLTTKIPGNFFSHPAFAAGTYWRALASIAFTPGTCAAKVTEWTRDAPGHVRSWTQRNTFFF